MEEGKQEVTEKGFRRGFREGVQISLRWARLSGRLRWATFVFVCGNGCVYSALEMFLQQERGECLSQELSQLKVKIERLGRVRGEEVSGDGEGGETRELWEVCEQADGSDDLVESQQQIEDALNALEKLLQTPQQ